MHEQQQREHLRAVARRQHGLFTLAQVLAIGTSRATVRRRLASGDWSEVDTRVYRIATGTPVDWKAVLMARVLTTKGWASHESAGSLFGLIEHSCDPVVSVLSSARTAARRTSHSTSCLPPVDRTSVSGIPATTPARTLLDLATMMPEPAFHDVLDVALLRRLVVPARLRARAEALWTPRRGGCAVVLRALDERAHARGELRNVWEARVLRELRARGLPEPSCNHLVRVGGRRRHLDFAWPAQAVALEFDGFEPHSLRRVFDDDRVRQNDLVDAGWRVFRVTSTSLTNDPKRTFGPIARALGFDL